ncbi:hypothetical protein C8P63_10116 [Melghirimyces profundicolus]|uniref:Uncharacterized protein n=1 Tax=Melghirimyces profundicolus TaxID=1242148 RepID=A0A2T6C905_9BACL|nr:hypothetical protein [Melghirimyces profundicolus]PTX64800.1 hypothetical protein C8P63_10116 [Melghirimyces profundicolus]
MRIIGGNYRDWKCLTWKEQVERFNRAKADYYGKMAGEACENQPFASKLVDFSGLHHCYPMQKPILH